MKKRNILTLITCISLLSGCYDFTEEDELINDNTDKPTEEPIDNKADDPSSGGKSNEESGGGSGTGGESGDNPSTNPETPEVEKFTITWVVEGTKSTTTVNKGEMPVYNGTPTKESTADKSYTFSGWEPSLAIATKDTAYTAKFTETKRKYKITFVVDGKSSSVDYEYGVTPSYGSTPTKESTAEYSYSFSGWEPSITSVTKDQTYTAKFSQTKRKYTITFVVDGKSTPLDFEYGTTPSYGSTPTKSSTDGKSYTFTGWEPSITTVTKATTYTAKFAESSNVYTITFVVDGKSTPLTYEYGATPSYGSTPTKESTAEYSYTFSGWDPSITSVTKDQTYTAKFTQTKRKYRITFVVDGKSTPVDYEYGVTPSYGSTPTKSSTAEYSYTFSGWEPSITSVTKDQTYTAKFTQTKRKYRITFVVDGKSTPIDFEYGTTPSYGSTPTKASTVEYSYTFSGWEPSITSVTKDQTYTAKFTQTKRKYRITFVVGPTETSKDFEYGTTPSYGSSNPSREGYNFIRWEPSISSVTKDQTYTAVFEEQTTAKYCCWKLTGNYLLYTLTDEDSNDTTYSFIAYSTATLKTGSQDEYTFTNPTTQPFKLSPSVLTIGSSTGKYYRYPEGDKIGDATRTTYYAYKYGNTDTIWYTKTLDLVAGQYAYTYSYNSESKMVKINKFKASPDSSESGALSITDSSGTKVILHRITKGDKDLFLPVIDNYSY